MDTMDSILLINCLSFYKLVFCGLLFLLLVPSGDHGTWNFDQFNRDHFEILVVIEVRIRKESGDCP